MRLRLCRQKMILFLAVLFSVLMYTPGYGIEESQKGSDDLLKLLETNVSTASKYNQTISEAPASVTIITGEEIERFGYRTLDEVLMRIRGFYITNDRNYSYVGVRGFSRPTDYNNRVLLLLNGNPTNDNVWGASYIGTETGLNIDVIDRIEIVRGPGSALYGTNAMLAVINIITKKGKTLDGLIAMFQPGNYGKREGGFNFGKEFKNGLDFCLSGILGKIAGQDLYFPEFDNPDTNNGKAENMDRDTYYGVFTSLAYKNLSLQGILASREKRIPTASYGTTFNDRRYRTRDSRGIIELKYEGKPSYNKTLMFRGSYYYYIYQGDSPYSDEGVETLYKDKSIGAWLGLETQFNWDLRANNRLIIGAEYKEHFRSFYKAWDDDGIWFEQDHPFRQFAFYVQDEYQALKNFSITLGLRYDKHESRGDSLSPRVGIIYNPSGVTTLKLLMGTAYRAPDFYSLFYEFENEEKSNPLVKPEKISTLETVLEHQLNRHVSCIFSLYVFEMKGLIEQILDETDGLLQFQNLDKVRGLGGEAELNLRLDNGTIGYLNVNLQSVKNVITKEKISNSPAVLGKLGVSVPLGKHFLAAAEAYYESHRLTLTGHKTSPFLLTDLHLSTRTLFNHFKISCKIKNIFNREYRLPGGNEHLQDALVQFGRMFTLKLEYLL